MNIDIQLDSMLRSVFREDADAAVGSIDVTGSVRARMLHTSRFRPSRRTKFVVGLAAAALTLSVAGALAVSSDTSGEITHEVVDGLIRLHWVRAPYSGAGTPVDMTMEKPYETTVADAEAKLGFHVQTLDGYAAAKTPVKMPWGPMQGIVFRPPVTAVNGQPIVHSTGAVVLYYDVDGVGVQIGEQMDPKGPGPMDVRLKDPDRPAPEMLKASVETINGAQYLVFRSPKDGGISIIQWKTPNGVLMSVSWNHPVNTALVASLLQHLH
jgi:hypothetical protein